MWLKRKRSNKPQASFLGSDADKQLGDIQKMTEELKLAYRFGVIKDDYYDAFIQALIEIHPEVRGHPKVREFIDKAQSYLAFKGDKTCLTCRYFPSCSVWITGGTNDPKERIPPELFSCGRHQLK